LDRLWVLLESGSTPVIRKAAAYQIGEIQKLHPHELHNLLKKVSKYLHSTAWETRIAAAHAIEAIARNVKKWDPPFECKMESDVKSDDSSGNDHQLSFDTFNIQQVLDHGVPLLSSTGDEFNKLEDDPDYQKMTQQEKAAFHRQQLKQKLGLVAQGKVFSTGLEQLFDDSDLIITSSVHQQAPRRTKQLVDVSELNALTGMSAREKNRAKRKAKMAAKKNKQNDKDCINDGQSSIGPPSAKKLKTSSVVVEQAGDSDKVLIDQVADEESLYDNSEEWPFTWFCQEMFHLLFNPQWEVRHGAASALREIIKLHGDTANIQASTPIKERKMKTQEWLSDVAIRLLCVFALDRFADFISDQVVAPVRATCAQVLGTICNQLDDDRLSKVVDILLVLGQQGLWEVRYAMLMGLQHVLAARMDVALSLLPVVSDSLLNSLQDADDDVRAVAAGALLPVAHQLNVIFIDKLPLLFQILWDCLLQLDDLSASTSSVMDLLACLLSNLTQDQFALLILESSLIGLVPRIYPFMYHRISSVRESCLKTLKSLMMGKKEWIQQLMDTLFVHLFQRLAFEGDASIRSLIFQVWEMILDSSDGERLSSIMSRYLIKWLSVLATPPTSCVDPSLIEVYSTKDVYLGGILDVEAMNIREQAYFTARVNNMKALGMLAMKVSPSSVQYLSETLNTMLATTSAVFKELLSLFVSSWANCPHDVADKLTSLLTESCIYDEVQPFLLSLQKDSYVLVTALEKKGIEASGGVNPSLYTVDFVVQLATTIYSNSMESLKLTSDERQDLEGFHRNLLTSLGQFQEQHQKYQIKIQCCTAGALITLHKLPPKLNPLIRPLMDSLKTHPDHFLQSLSAGWLSQLLDQCHGRSPCPNPKIIKNICSFLCCDSDITPSVLYDQANALTKRSLSPEEDENGKNNGMVEESDNGSNFNWRDGILSLKKATAKVNQMKRGPGRPSAAIKESLVAVNESQAFNIQRSGGELAMTALGKHFGDELFTKLPDIWSIISEPLANIPAITDHDVLNEDVAKVAQNIINSLQILEVFAPVVHKGLKEKFLSLLPSLLSCIISNFTAVRHMGARATAAIAMQHLHQVMEVSPNI
jgi:TATA-binding protein-associated factor